MINVLQKLKIRVSIIDSISKKSAFDSVKEKNLVKVQ